MLPEATSNTTSTLGLSLLFLWVTADIWSGERENERRNGVEQYSGDVVCMYVCVYV